MALDKTDKTTFWGAVSSNYFWGRRSGMIYPDKTNAFKIKKWANGVNNSGKPKTHSGPVKKPMGTLSRKK
jgi:hypothetical protein